jgi:hypothetical protein
VGIFNLFSKRQKQLRGEIPDVYVYDDVPESLRVQLVQMIEDGIGHEDRYNDLPKQLYHSIHKTLCREYGRFSLTDKRNASDWEHISEYLLETDDIEHIIDIVELSLYCVDTTIRRENWKIIGCNASPDETIHEVNSRFKEHGVGYEYVAGQMIRIDSQLMHEEVIKPALKLLADSRFNGANDEFIKAHEHYRHGRHKECLADCLKAFESTMKTICDLKNWQYQPSDTAKNLIDICISKGLLQNFMQSHVGNLRTILESGVPTVRNKLGGHGQGTNVTVVSEATARFALNSTAANILLFVESM